VVHKTYRHVGFSGGGGSYEDFTDAFKLQAEIGALEMISHIFYTAFVGTIKGAASFLR
jgi:hypothetical protein